MASASNHKDACHGVFYRLGDALSNSAFRGYAEPHRDVMWRIFRAEDIPNAAIRVSYSMGHKLQDFLWAELYPLIHDRVVGLLVSAGITGWATYPVEVYDRRGALVSGYQGLSIAGRCASILLDRDHSELVYVRKPRAWAPHYKGLFITTDSWDGSDFFTAADGKTGFTIMTERVRDLFLKAKVTNVVIEPVSEVQVYAMDEPSLPLPIGG